MSEGSHSRAHLHKLLDDLPADRLSTAELALAALAHETLWPLAAIPGIRLPADWPPRFVDTTPMPYEGEPPSEQLIRERR